MATTLVDLETLKSLSNIARERGRLLPLIDVLLEWAEHAETHIAHMARLLEGQGITCSCQEMDPADPNCLLHGYVEMDDPLPEPKRYCDNYEQNLRLETEQTCVHCGEMQLFHPVELTRDANGVSMSLSHFRQLHPPSDDN